MTNPSPPSRKAPRFKAWLLHQALPRIQRGGEWVVQRLTTDRAATHWTALTPSRRWSRVIIYALVGVAGFGVVWACFARIDETVQATGKLEPRGTTKAIKAPIGGVISDIRVRDGQAVKAGQILLVLDTEAARAKLKALEAVRERTAADLALSRSTVGDPTGGASLNSNQSGKLLALQAEYASRIRAAQQAVVQAEVSLREANIQLRSREQAMAIKRQVIQQLEPLVRMGGFGKVQYQKELQEYVALVGEVQQLRQAMPRLRAALDETKQRLVNTKSLTKIDFRTKIEEGEKQLAELSNQISEARVTLRYQNIRSPVNGVVFDLKPTAPGFVVNTNDAAALLKVVPTDALVARIFVANRDIGFVRPGQRVDVRVDAFPYNEFGDVKGAVASIGSDVLEPDPTYNFFRFPVTVNLSKSHLAYRGRQLRLLSGMSVTANIVLRQRPVIAIFTQQILPFWDSLEKL